MTHDDQQTSNEDVFEMIELGAVSEETRGFYGQGVEIEEGLSKVQP
ncbi:hypothetical protein [Hyphomonas sp. CY54-11-8]|jgi:hypothetical protein|nr:hypothetical protein [Hyphomonas sp. CY54-11-8]KCZ48653.1 hypothetical protein HY17_16250 [Hyphomonas sp. CY54-11-8]